MVAALAPPPGAHKNQRQRRRLSAEAAEIVPATCAALAALCGSSAAAHAAVSHGGSWPAVAVAFRQVHPVLQMMRRWSGEPAVLHVSFTGLFQYPLCPTPSCLVDLHSTAPVLLPHHGDGAPSQHFQAMPVATCAWCVCVHRRCLVRVRRRGGQSRRPCSRLTMC
jgi:hypothetical protein